MHGIALEKVFADLDSAGAHYFLIDRDLSLAPERDFFE